MEELVDISQDCGPLLFCCCAVAAPLPIVTGLEYYSPKPLFSLVFFFFLSHSLTQLQPLLPSAFVKDGPSTTPPPLSLSRTVSLALSLYVHSFRWLRAERGALKRRVFGRPVTRCCCFLQKNPPPKCQESAFLFASTPPHSRLLHLSLCIAVSVQ